MEKQHIFVIGSKGIPASYGGFETFVEQMVRHNSGNIMYHVACMATEKETFYYQGAECVKMKVPSIGAAKAVYYDCQALSCFIRYCKKHKEIKRSVFCVLACRIGPFIPFYKAQIKKLGGVLIVNPDGQEWKRRKWNKLIRWYWKFSEKGMIKNADKVVCDSREIEKYILKEYASFAPDTSFIPYGAQKITLTDQGKLENWLKKNKLQRKEYSILVGRFVPENNFDIIIREYMRSNTSRKLIVITDHNKKLKKKIQKATFCEKDDRILFPGAVYDTELLCAIRENAYLSFHGHEVGGTNPSLLEGLCCTELNLILDVPFNREVAEDGALYWNKQAGNLARLIDDAESMDAQSRQLLHEKAKDRIHDVYNWEMVEKSYRKIFMENANEKNGFC